MWVCRVFNSMCNYRFKTLGFLQKYHIFKGWFLVGNYKNDKNQLMHMAHLGVLYTCYITEGKVIMSFGMYRTTWATAVVSVHVATWKCSHSGSWTYSMFTLAHLTPTSFTVNIISGKKEPAPQQDEFRWSACALADKPATALRLHVWQNNSQKPENRHKGLKCHHLNLGLLLDYVHVMTARFDQTLYIS